MPQKLVVTVKFPATNTAQILNIIQQIANKNIEIDELHTEG